MYYGDIAELLNKEIESLLDQLDENTIDVYVNDMLIIKDDSDNSNKSDKEIYAELSGFKLLDNIENIKWKKRSWITEEQFQNISQLLDKYPNSHRVIKKHQGISQSTLYRIKKQTSN